MMCVCVYVIEIINMFLVAIQVLEYTARDYIKNWYRDVSDDDLFLLQIHQCVQKAFITFSQR